MKILSTITLIPLLSVLSFGANANDKCGLDYNINLRLGYSKGSFDVKHHQNSTDFTKTHNNASRLGGYLAYKCGAAMMKYTHHSVIDLSSSNDLTSKKIISTYSFSHDDYGSLQIGQLTTPYKAAGKSGDPFWDTASGLTSAANNFGFSDMTRGFTHNSVIYSAPSIGNFNFKLGYTGVNSSGDHHYGLEYKAQSSVMGLQYLDMGDNPYVANSRGYDTAVRLYARHGFNDWLVSGSVEKVDKLIGDSEAFYNVSIEKKVADFGRFAMSYGHVTDANSKLMNGSVFQGDGSGFTAGAFYKWTDASELYLLTSLLEFDDGVEQKSIVLGFNYNFQFTSALF